MAGRPIVDAFRGQLSFAYWLPDPQTERAAAPRPVPVPEFTPGRRSVLPLLPLHGVDFSGARETGGRNGKIWIASWYPDRDFVELRSGGADPGFDRVGLGDQIIQGSGTWVIDFPFGPPAAVAAAAGWHSWHEYLAWCRSHFDPTALRDELRETLRRAGVPWSTKRNIDHALRTTWFPFFEQLYRQTIAGGRDVLGAVDQAGRDRTRILPFHDFGVANPRVSVVIEGFPGWTLAQCGLPRTGYKHSGRDAVDTRRGILDALRKRGVPISDADTSTAIHDAEGDAVDALVLLHAAHHASRRSGTEWGGTVGSHADIEGWFFD